MSLGLPQRVPNTFLAGDRGCSDTSHARRAQGDLHRGERPGGSPYDFPYTDDAGWGLQCGAV